MYKKYKDSLAPGSGHEYTDSGSSPSPKGDNKTKLGSSGGSKAYKEYYYGKERKKPSYWERDFELHKNYLLRWKREALDDSPREGSHPPAAPPPPPIPEPPPVPSRPKPPAEDLQKALHVENVDFHIAENTFKHRTSDYACTDEREYQGRLLDPELVVRRGANIKITITFDRPYNKKNNELQLLFSLGEKPTPSRGTLARLFMDESGKENFRPDKWGATLQSKSGKDISLLVHIPCNCIIGEWNFTVKLYSEEKDENGKDIDIIWQYTHDEDITVLFNPWCKHDPTYMEKEKDLDEYVLNDNGCVYRGNWKQTSAKEWNFGQFEEEILDIAMYILRCGFRGGTSKQMSDPVMVSRIIAKMVNCCDDSGVLVGNWSGDYKTGISPSKLSGSIKILKQWRRNGPVRYGQCWVFSGVTTTVCRALGIPCRSVTNFASAHDTDVSCCIEKYYINRATNEVDNYLSSDSVWNFHVWNEAWMSRPDLKDLQPGYECLREAGWQVIDATPQELSEGVFTCGPCPVAAVRMGYCAVKYDADFIFAEVNADKIYYEMQPDGEYKRTECHKRSVGKKISTKIADGLPYQDKTEEDEGSGGWYYMRDSLSEKKRHDLTLDYKPKEGSDEERTSVLMAQKKARNPRKENYEEVKEEKEIKKVEFHLNHDDNTMVGGEMKIHLTAKNHHDHDRHLSCIEIAVTSKTYTGQLLDVLFRKPFKADVLKAGEERSFDAVLQPSDYSSKLVEQVSFSVVATAMVDHVGNEDLRVLHKEHDVRFRMPDLEVKCPKTTKVGQEANFKVSFKNPLDVALTECDISMESAGFKDIEDEKVADVPPGGEYTITFCLKANKKPKNASLTFSFDCEQLKDISGGCSIKIEE